MSKNTSCQHKFKQGTKKGKLCKKQCRGKFCCDHKPKKKTYKKKYYEEKQKENKDRFISTFKIKLNSIDKIEDLPSINKFEEELRKLNSNNLELFKRLIGLGIFLGNGDTISRKYIEAQNKKYEESFNEFIDDLGELDDDNMKTIRNHLANTMPRKQIYFEYKGRPEKAQKKVEKLHEERNKVIEKIRQRKKIIELINKRKEEIELDLYDIINIDNDIVNEEKKQQYHKKYYKNHKEEILQKKQQRINSRSLGLKEYVLAKKFDNK